MARPTPEPQPQWSLIYDSDCGLCRWSLGLLLGADRGHRLRPVALGTPQADSLLSELTPEQRMASFHLVSPDGERSSAGAALPAVLRLLPAGTAPAAVLALAPRGTERGYRWIAEHRTTLGPLVPGRAKRAATARIERRARELDRDR